MRIAEQKGDWTSYVYHTMDCAEIEHLAGRREQAIAFYERILQLEDRVVLGPHARADCVMQVRQLVATVKFEIYLRIGEFHLDSQRPHRAELYLEKSTRLKPGVWDTHFALGRCYLAQGRGLEAAEEFRETLRLVVDYSPESIPEIQEWLDRC